MLMLQQLLRSGGVKPGNYLERHVEASLRVIRSMGCAATSNNQHSNRMVRMIVFNFFHGKLVKIFLA